MALDTQEKNPLPDNCLKEVYASKANAYISYIRPNLPYAIADIDAFKYVVDLMPKGMFADKNGAC